LYSDNNFIPRLKLYGLLQSEPYLFRRVRKITKSNYYLRHVCVSISPSVCSHETAHILCSKKFLFENRVVYDIMRKYTAELHRPQMTIWRMPIACWN